MNKPTVSVIVPVYNVEKYLRDCIDSIRRQTYQDFEIIMVEDCSTDGSRAIAEEIAAEDKRTRLFCHTRNMGQSAARNLGMDVARGEYVSFVDSDDFIESYCLSDMMYFAERENADVVSMGFKNLKFDVEHGGGVRCR